MVVLAIAKLDCEVISLLVIRHYAAVVLEGRGIAIIWCWVSFLETSVMCFSRKISEPQPLLESSKSA